ncbi:hypothetical protein GCM10011579_009130 [Streptomyces albiflavescens]|uniref:Secreted protein n=1 Tax=Streptomyces albiflavescens TaxID=1623582 RepID=A0A917XTB9_9ACTN|nr:DUF6493 family protein [Streptomyces albiflavescens]GGN52287.1 hypothetical protein GCM10011579_009130 [Streptomyces albiflavescens]
MSGEALVRAVRAGQTVEAAGHLDGMTDAERRTCLPALKELRKELRTAQWSESSRKAYPALHAAGAACHTGAAGAATWIASADMRWSQASPGVFLRVLGDREPAWLGDVAHRLAERPVTSRISYALLSGLVQLSGCEVPITDAYVEGWFEHIGSTWHRGGTVVERLRQEPHLARMIAALFDSLDVTSRVAWLFGDGPGSWYNALAELAGEGTLDREVLVDACVARLLRGGAPADQRVFLKLLTCLDLSRDEERERSADWIALASQATSTVAWHAQSVLASLALADELTPRQLAEMSSGVLFRTEKKLVRAQLVLLGRTLRRDPSTAGELLPAVAQAFGHEDTEVQERALKLVERHVAGPDVPEGVREQLVKKAAELSPGVRIHAERLLGAEALSAAPVIHVEVLPPVPERARLAPAPASAAELAEEVGALLASGGDVAAFERTLDGLVRQAYDDRDGLVEALRPVVARRWWIDADPHYPNVDTYFREAPYGLEVVLATLLGHVRTDTLHAAVQQGTTRGGCRHAALSRAFDARLWEVAHRILVEPLPFLLATPTWGTGLLEPEELVARLSAYRRLDTRPGTADFAQSLLRVRRDDRATAEAAAGRARALGTPEGYRLAQWLTAEGPDLPLSRRRTSGVRILLELGELEELQGQFPSEFRGLGRPLSVFKDRWYCPHWDQSDRQHWSAVAPGRRELVAARVLDDLSSVAVDDSRRGAAILPLLAEADGEAGEALHLCLAYGLGARHTEDRLSAVDALLVLAARGQLDAGRLGGDLGQLVRRGAVKPLRLAESIRTAAATGAYATVWSVLRETLPILLADLSTDATIGTPARGLGDLLAVAADCAERTGARGDVAHLAQAAGRRGSSKLVTQARRLRTALSQGVAA